jgi:dephospho-CoA kinase
VRVALTGGIATGKTTVARALRAAGVATVDADLLARDAVVPGSAGLAEVTARFGGDVLHADGTLDRQALAAVVFADVEARRDLEHIIHPRVRQGIDAFFTALADGAPGIAEIPLVYETGWGTAFDTVVVVACHPATQRARLMARDGHGATDADRRLNAQWPITDKVRLADAVVVTDGDMASTLEQSVRLAAWLRGRYRLS